MEDQLKTWESSATETKIKNILIPYIPDEPLLEIMSYLSTYDVLKNVARVSKRFHKLSKDSHVIRKIEVDPAQFWHTDKEEKYWDEFLRVLKRSLKLRSLSFGFSSNMAGEKFFEAMSSMNHKFLQEFCLKIDVADWNNWVYAWRYLYECPDLKVLKFELEPEETDDGFALYSFASVFERIECLISVISSELKKLQEIHFIGMDMDNLDEDKFKMFLDMIAENFPKLQRLCLTVLDFDFDFGYYNMCLDFASEKNIQIEITCEITALNPNDFNIIQSKIIIF